MLAVRLDDATGGLERLARATWHALAHEPEHPRFLAHVTVARGAVALPAHGPPPAPVRFEAVTLYRSHPGSRYEALASVDLRS